MKRVLYKRILFVLLGAWLPFVVSAETKEQRAQSPHELRIGVGDPIMARLFNSEWDDPNVGAGIWRQTFGLPVDEADDIMRNKRYAQKIGKTHILGHFFLEYQYRLTPYVSVGMSADVLNVWKNYNIYNGYGDKVGRTTTGVLYMDFVPKARFTFFHRQYVNLYASAGVGFAMVTTYSGEDFRGAAKLDATLFGISFGENHFFGALEFLDLGFVLPVTEPLPIQIFTASIGYRF